MRTLVAVAHGTRSAAGQRQIRALVDRVAVRRPGLDVRLCFVDVQQPRIGDTMRGVRDAVIVPLFLSTGYHVRVDIAEAAGDSVVTAPLGPDPVLTESMARHLGHTDAVVLAAAGSTDPGWRAGVAGIAAELGAHVGYASGTEQRVPDVVAGLRRQGAEHLTVAAYLLADGVFYRSLHRAGATAVTPPLCHDPAVTDLVLRRCDPRPSALQLAEAKAARRSSADLRPVPGRCPGTGKSGTAALTGKEAVGHDGLGSKYRRAGRDGSLC